MITLCPFKLVHRHPVLYFNDTVSNPIVLFNDVQTLEPVILSPNNSSILSLDNFFTFSYGHWLEAFLPLLMLPKTVGYVITEVELPPSTIQRFHIKQWCDILSLPRYLPTERTKASISHSLCMSLVHPDWIELLRSFIPMALEAYPQPPNQKILIQRCQLGSGWNTSRNLENRHEFLTRFSSSNFSVMYMEDLPVLQQVAIFASASVIIGVHGSALSNLMFCNPSCKVIEIRSPLFWNSTYAGIGSYLNLNYSLILGSEHHGNTGLYSHCVHADLDIIEKALSL